MMSLDEKSAYVNRIFGLACSKGLCKTRVEFARLLDINPTTLSGAMNSRPEYLTDKIIGRVVMFAASNNLEGDAPEEGPSTVLVIPYGAVIKRIRKTEDDGLVECVSINPAYQSYTIPRDFVRGWYRVLMVMSLK